MFENPRRSTQARNFATNVPKILDLKSSFEQIFFRKLSLGAPGCGTCPYLKQGKEFTFSATNETFRIKQNLIYVITCAGCGHNYIGETGDVLRNRVTVHKQQIRDPHTRMLGVSKHIDECAAGLTPQFTISFRFTRFSSSRFVIDL